MKAGHLQSMLDVSSRLRRREPVETRKDRDALPKLEQAARIQCLDQLRLPAQDNLHELRAGRLEIRKHAHELKSGLTQVLCLIDEHHQSLSSGGQANQHFIQLCLEIDQTALRVGDLEIDQQRSYQLQRRRNSLE
jgi:hypothetical protein